MISVVNANLYDFETYRENRYVVFDGTIRATGPMDGFVPGGGTVVDARGAIVMPGLVLGHTHVYGTFARGLRVPFEPKDFRGILEQLWWKLDRNLDLPAVAASGAAAALDYLRNGVTAIVDHHASGTVRGSLSALARAMTEVAPMRGAFCFETSDRFDVSACIDENLAFEKNGGVTAPLFGLHASMTLSEETLRLVAASRGLLPVHVHAAESRQDEEDCLARYGERVIARFDRHGLVTKGSLYVHCVHCDAAELDILAKRGAVVAVNPTSNMNNGVGLPDVAAMMSRGIPVILGDDGISASAAAELRNLYFTAHHRQGSPTGFAAEDLRRIVTDTYRFASDLFGVPLGRIETGYAADLLVLDYDPPTPIGDKNAFGHFLFGMTPAFRPRHVFASGRHVVADFVPDAGIARRARDAAGVAAAVWKRIEREEPKP